MMVTKATKLLCGAVFFGADVVHGLITRRATSSFVQSTDKVIRSSYRFAFEDDAMIEGREPTQAEIEAVMCQTNVFLSKGLQHEFGNAAIVVQAEEIDYSFEDFSHEGIEAPVNINFTMGLLTTDNSTLPNLEDIQQSLKALDYQEYLTRYVWKATPVTKNFFFMARGVVWKSQMVRPVPGKLSKISCPEGAQPQAIGGSFNKEAQEKKKKAADNATDVSTFTGFSLKLGFWEGMARKPTDMEWEALICEVDRFLNKDLQRGLEDNSIASYAKDIHWKYVNDAYLPAQVNFTVTAVFGNGTDVQSSDIFQVLKLNDISAAKLTADYINVAFPDGHSVFGNADKLYLGGSAIAEVDPDEPSFLAKAVCPVTVRTSDAASFTFMFDFDDDHEREPTKVEVEAMLCETNKFFQRTLRTAMEDPSITSSAININWGYNPADKYSSVVEFTSLTLKGDGSHVNGTSVLQVMKEADVQFFIEFYILNSIPYERNIYFYSKDVSFSGEIGRNVTQAKVPNGVKCQNYQLNRLAYFTIQIGFDDHAGVPSRQEIEELMCQTQRFFNHQLKKVLLDDSISSSVTNVDWEFVAGEEMPAVVNFTSLSTYGDGSLVPAKLVYDVMKSVPVEDFATDYVWKVQESNIYYYTKNILFGGRVNALPSEGKLDKVTCVNAPALIGTGNHTMRVSGTDGNSANKGGQGKERHVTKVDPHDTDSS